MSDCVPPPPPPPPPLLRALMRAYIFHSAVRCGAGAGLNIEGCGAVRAPALNDCAVRVRASSLRGGAVAGQTFRPAQGFNILTIVNNTQNRFKPHWLSNSASLVPSKPKRISPCIPIVGDSLHHKLLGKPMRFKTYKKFAS